MLWIRGEKIRDLAYAVIWAMAMVILWGPSDEYDVLVSHGDGQPHFERIYGLFGYYFVDYPRFGPATSNLDPRMLLLTGSLTLGVTAGCLKGVLKKAPRPKKRDPFDLE